MLQHDLRDERAGLEVPTALELEQVALRTDHRALCEPLHQPEGLLGGGLRRSLGRLRRHLSLPLSSCEHESLVGRICRGCPRNQSMVAEA